MDEFTDRSLLDEVMSGKTLSQIEYDVIRMAMLVHKGNKSKVAKALGISERGFRKKIVKEGWDDLKEDSPTLRWLCSLR